MSSFSCQHRHSTIALGDGRPIGTMRDGTKYAAGQLISKPMVWLIFSYLAASSLTVPERGWRHATGLVPVLDKPQHRRDPGHIFCPPLPAVFRAVPRRRTKSASRIP